jgi:GT2 family glycosyltransferase
MEATSLSIVVVSHFGGPILARCVQSLQAQMRPDDQLEVVISAGPGVAETQGIGSELVFLGENLGFAKAANVGFSRATHPLILLLNDDTEAEPGFLQALRTAVNRPGLYQPRILLADGSGRLDNIGHGLFPDGFNWAHGRRDLDNEAYDAPGEAGACSGAAMLVHRQVLNAIGDFDGDFEAFGEDLDFSLRARRAGFGIFTVPSARIRHHLGASYGRYTPKKLFWIERNRVRAAVRSLPVSALLSMPAWTGIRVVGLSFAAFRGHGYAGEVDAQGTLASARGLMAGLACVPDAWRKRKRDALGWTCSDRAMWGALFRHRIRVQDVLR